MTNPNLDLEALVGELRRHLPLLDSAAIPTKSEVFTICGRPARDLHNAIISVTDRLQASEAEVERSEKHRNDLADTIIKLRTELGASRAVATVLEYRATTAEAALTQLL